MEHTKKLAADNNAHRILAKYSKFFSRSIAVEESTLEATVPDYYYISGYLRSIGVLKQSTEICFLTCTKPASNFFDYFEVLTFLLFVEAVPSPVAKVLAADFTLHLINIWDSAGCSVDYPQFMNERYDFAGAEFELQDSNGEVVSNMGGILAILTTIAVETLQEECETPRNTTTGCRLSVSPNVEAFNCDTEVASKNWAHG